TRSRAGYVPKRRLSSAAVRRPGNRRPCIPTRRIPKLRAHGLGNGMDTAICPARRRRGHARDCPGYYQDSGECASLVSALEHEGLTDHVLYLADPTDRLSTLYGH